jgi:hypothetical protein
MAIIINTTDAFEYSTIEIYTSASGAIDAFDWSEFFTALPVVDEPPVPVANDDPVVDPGIDLTPPPVETGTEGDNMTADDANLWADNDAALVALYGPDDFLNHLDEWVI